MDDIIKKPWHFVYDTNGDGVITISDIINWLIWLFFLPGDSFLYFMMTRYPDVARFFEISNDNFHGVLSGFISLIAWFFAILILSSIAEVSNRKEIERQRKSDKEAVEESVKEILERDQKIMEEKWKDEKDHLD